HDRLDAVKVCFDDERAVANAGVLLVATLAERLGLQVLVGECVRLGKCGARFRPGRRVMSLVFAMLLGAQSIDGCDVLRSGRTGRLLGVRVLGYHPLLATRADTGEVLHIRFRTGKANTQRGVIRFVDELVARVRAAGASSPILLRADSGFHNKALRARLAAKGVAYSIGARVTKRVAAAITQIADEHWQTLTDYPATA
ncbi:MAG: transposase, partial [Actinobacteria bacterium]|nr:transposase [Actinomycetota bacterium]